MFNPSVIRQHTLTLSRVVDGRTKAKAIVASGAIPGKAPDAKHDDTLKNWEKKAKNWSEKVSAHAKAGNP